MRSIPGHACTFVTRLGFFAYTRLKIHFVDFHRECFDFCFALPLSLACIWLLIERNCRDHRALIAQSNGHAHRGKLVSPDVGGSRVRFGVVARSEVAASQLLRDYFLRKGPFAWGALSRPRPETFDLPSANTALRPLRVFEIS